MGHVISIGAEVLHVVDTGMFVNVHMEGVFPKARVRLWSHQCHMAELRPDLSEAGGVQTLREVGARTWASHLPRQDQEIQGVSSSSRPPALVSVGIL